MAQDIFERLAASEVPPLPEQFEEQVHERLNHALVALHLLDFAVRAMPLAMLELSRAVVGLLVYTLSQRFPTDKGEDHDTLRK